MAVQNCGLRYTIRCLSFTFFFFFFWPSGPTLYVQVNYFQRRQPYYIVSTYEFLHRNIWFVPGNHMQTSLHGNCVHVLNWHKWFMYIPGTLSNIFSNSKWGLEPVPWEIFFLNHFKIYQQDCRSEIKWPVFVRNFFWSWPEGNKY